MKNTPMKGFTKNSFLLIALLFAALLSIESYGQGRLSNPLFLHMHDKMIVVDKYENIGGTPFLNEEWQLAAVLLKDGIVAENVKVKINLLDNEVHYLDDDGKEMVSTQEIKSVIFKKGNDTTSVFISKFALPNNAAAFPEGWMQLLAKGEASLLKSFHKEIAETKGYSSATIEKNIVTEVRYFIWHKNQLTRVKTTSDIAAAIQDPALTAMLDQTRKNSKAEDDMKNAVSYFNSLKH